MKLREKASRFESLALRHKHHLTAVLELMNDQFQWTPPTDHGSYTVQYAWIKRSKMRSIVAYHVKYTTAQSSIGNRFDKWETRTLEEVLKHNEQYGWRQLPGLEDELKPDPTPQPEPKKPDLHGDELNRLVDELFDLLPRPSQSKLPS